jgi:DnaJ-class molecular chaperone
MGDMAGAGGLGDLLGQMFGGGRRAGGGVGPQRGSDLEASLTIDFVDAAQGLTTSLHITSEAVCSTCNGSGARPGTSPVRCSHCGGRGVADMNQGGFAFSVPCSPCGGRGSKVEHPCGTCRGSGVEMRNREVNVRVLASMTVHEFESRVVVHQDAMVVRQVTCSSCVVSRRTRCSHATGGTCWCAYPCRSPQPHWAPMSLFPRWRVTP